MVNMRKVTLVAVILLLLLGTFLYLLWGKGAGSLNSSEKIHPLLGYPFNFSLGQTAVIEDTNDPSGKSFHITFLDVLEDSRCPSDVVCVQQGRAVISVKTETRGITSYYNLTQEKKGDPVLIDIHATTRFIDLFPYPVSTRKIEKDEYVATIVVAHA